MNKPRENQPIPNSNIGPFDDGTVKAIIGANAWQFDLSAVTSQAKVYKEALHRFFRQTMPIAPKSGEFEVEINIAVNPNYPTIDVDNVAKAVLDGLKGHVFYDDGQIMRLLVQKHFAPSEQIEIKVKLRA
jgi:crossover junction endodeoxyribonuclease RusA